ncbi:MAG: hypothetical protein ABL993_02045 [Vicinamibacterales bacterium]
MQPLKSTILLFTVLIATSASAVAQQAPAPGTRPLRGYLIGGGGATVESSSTALTLSAEIAENVTPDVQVYVTFGYYENLMTQSARDRLAEVGRSLTLVNGVPWEFNGRDRGRSFSAGGKFLVPMAGSVRPYVGGGVGVINLKRTVVERSRGVMTSEFLSAFGSGDGIVDAAQTNTNKPMGELVGGVGVSVGRAYVDLGYRYRKVFHNVGQSFGVSQLGAAVGIGF